MNWRIDLRNLTPIELKAAARMRPFLQGIDWSASPELIELAINGLLPWSERKWPYWPAWQRIAHAVAFHGDLFNSGTVSDNDGKVKCSWCNGKGCSACYNARSKRH